MDACKQYETMWQLLISNKFCYSIKKQINTINCNWKILHACKYVRSLGGEYTQNCKKSKLKEQGTRPDLCQFG